MMFQVSCRRAMAPTFTSSTSREWSSPPWATVTNGPSTAQTVRARLPSNGFSHPLLWPTLRMALSLLGTSTSSVVSWWTDQSGQSSDSSEWFELNLQGELKHQIWSIFSWVISHKSYDAFATWCEIELIEKYCIKIIYSLRSKFWCLV